MKIAIIGATGTIGHNIVEEALERRHTVTAVIRDASRSITQREGLTAVRADVLDASELASAIVGHEAVVSAIGPGHGSPVSVISEASRKIAAAAMKTRVRRIVIVGGAGSLQVKPGVQLLASPNFPEAWRQIALAHSEALEIWRRVKELDWTYVSPPALMEPGRRTGRYRTGHDDLLIDDNGESRISTQDFAVAILDLIENRSHIGERVTFAH